MRPVAGADAPRLAHVPPAAPVVATVVPVRLLLALLGITDELLDEIHAHLLTVAAETR